MPTFNSRAAASVVFVATIHDLRMQPNSHRVERGDDIKLYCGQTEVFVRVTEVEGDKFVGAVIGANAHGATADPALAAGAAVRFSEQHIFTCSKRARPRAP